MSQLRKWIRNFQAEALSSLGKRAAPPVSVGKHSKAMQHKGGGGGAKRARKAPSTAAVGPAYKAPVGVVPARTSPKRAAAMARRFVEEDDDDFEDEDEDEEVAEEKEEQEEEEEEEEDDEEDDEEEEADEADEEKPGQRQEMQRKYPVATEVTTRRCNSSTSVSSTADSDMVLHPLLESPIRLCSLVLRCLTSARDAWPP